MAGLSAVPGDAPVVAINASKYTCHNVGGKGAMREFAEHILLQKQKAKSQMKQDRIDSSFWRDTQEIYQESERGKWNATYLN